MPGIERDPTRRVPQPEERRGQQTGEDCQREQAREHPGLMRQVVEGTRRVLEPGGGGRRGRPRSFDHLGRGFVETVAGQHVRPGTDLDRALQGSIEGRLLDIGRAVTLGDAVALARVVLLDQEHHGWFGVGRQPRAHLVPVARRRVAVVLARSVGRTVPPEVLDGPDEARLILRQGAGQTGPEHVGVRLRPSVRGVGSRRVVGVAVVHDQDARPLTGGDHHLPGRRQRGPHALRSPLVVLLRPPVDRGVEEDPGERAHDDERPHRSGDPASALAPVQPSDGEERAETRERHRSRRGVHEAVVRDRLSEQEREHAGEREHPPDRNLLVLRDRRPGPPRDDDRAEDRDQDQRERDLRAASRSPTRPAAVGRTPRCRGAAARHPSGAPDRPVPRSPRPRGRAP